MQTGRLSHTMNTMRTQWVAPAAKANGLVVWILLALGLLLMLVSVSDAEQPSASRVDRFRGPLASGQTLHVENGSGHIVATPGKEFSAVVTVQVVAPTEKKAQQLLDSTKIVGD